MLDDKDIQKLKEVFATKGQIKEMLEPLVTKEMFKENNKNLLNDFSNVFATKTDFEKFKEEYREDFSKFLTKLDKETGKEVDEKQETTMLAGKVQRHEKWIGQIAKKVDLKLES